MEKEKLYPYAVARIRVLEKNLLSKQALLNMADSREVADCLRSLAGVSYEGALDVESHDFGRVLTLELEKTYALIRELVPEEKFINVFLYKNDYHNLRVLIKQSVSGISGSHLLIDGGTQSLESLKQAILERNYAGLPKVMGDAIKDAFLLYSKTQSGQMIDIVLDRAAFVQMKDAAKESGNEFVINYVEKVSDCTNLKSFMRMRAMNKDFLAFSSVFVPSGSISESIFFTAYGMDTPAATFKSTNYGEICEEGMTRGFTTFEKLCDNFIMEYIKSAKYIALTLEPLIAYLYAKESEIKTIRIILTSKLNDIDASVIKERVREAYV